MAEIEIGPLSERLSDDEIGDLKKRLDRLGAPKLPAAPDHAGGKGDQVDSEALEELLDRLDEHEAACEIYLPVEFDGRAEVGGWRVGSAPILLEVLDEVKDELDLEEEDEDEEDELDEDDDVVDQGSRKTQLIRAWKLLYAGAQAAIEQRLPLLLSV